mmetsp:Transcript_3277/g.9298  ORF Transcript_3277/g.9298 Transcript_3277/m.9298 type:complete len:516 (+) Transcript_3277:3-1550(+)
MKCCQFDPVLLLRSVNPVQNEAECGLIVKILMDATKDTESDILHDLSDPEVHAFSSSVARALRPIDSVDEICDPTTLLLARVALHEASQTGSPWHDDRESILSKIVPDIPVLCEVYGMHAKWLMEAIGSSGNTNNNDDDDGDDGEHEFLLPFQPLLNGIALSTSLQYFSVWGGIFPSHSNPVVNRHNDEDDRDANNSIISNFVDCLQRNRSIQVLNLRFMNVSDSVLGRLCGALANHPSLHSLNLSGSKCSARTLTALASTMAPSSTLTPTSKSTSSHASPSALRLRVLDLSNLRLHLTPSFDAEKHDESLRHAWAAFCKTLAINTSLVELNLSGSGVFNRGKGLCYHSVSALADAMHHNSTLRQLDVSSCSLDDRSILLFTTHALLQQSHLQEWKIKYNPISKHSTLIAIIKMLRHNNVYLESIDFRGRASRNHDITNEEELKLQIKYWTTLNRSGRRLLLSSSSSNDDDETSIGIWPHVFCQISRTTAQRNDAISAHDVIYFFLKNQPTLFAS